MRLKSPRIPSRCTFNSLRAVYQRSILSPKRAIEALYHRRGWYYCMVERRGLPPWHCRAEDLKVSTRPLDERDRNSGFLGMGSDVAVVEFSRKR